MLLSKLQKLSLKITERNQTSKFHESAKAIDDIIINNLSQVYIPITKGELWDEEDKKKEKAKATEKKEEQDKKEEKEELKEIKKEMPKQAPQPMAAAKQQVDQRATAPKSQ